MSGKIVGNYFICKNEVFIEGRSIGPFTSFTTEDSRDNIFGTANIRMPFLYDSQREVIGGMRSVKTSNHTSV